jgi:hypothetical protein
LCNTSKDGERQILGLRKTWRSLGLFPKEKTSHHAMKREVKEETLSHWKTNSKDVTYNKKDKFFVTCHKE